MPTNTHLRYVAEQLLRNGTVPSPELRSADFDSLVHELHVCHAELMAQKCELEAAQVEAEQARAEYAQLFHYAPAAILFVDRRGTVRQANQTAARTLGVGLEVLRGKPLVAFLAGDAHPEFHRRLKAALGGGARGSLEARCVRPGAGAFVAELQLEWWPMSPPGEPLVAVTVRDVTEREAAARARRDAEEAERVARERTQAALDALPARVALLDPDGVVVAANPAWVRGGGRPGEPFLATWARAAEGAPDAGVADGLRAVLTGAAAQFSWEHQNGTGAATRWFRSAVTPAPAGPALGAVVMHLDVTDQHLLEERVRQAQKMEAVGRLAAGIAHDFNNLLTIINGYAELLLGEFPAGSRPHGLLKEVWRAGERSAGLTRQLLTFSHKRVLRPRALELNRVVAGAESLLRRLIGEDVRVVTALDPEAGAVHADAGQLEQVLMNLAINARDAMPTGGLLTIRTGAFECGPEQAGAPPGAAPGRYAALTVSDTGCGMSAEVRAHLFEPFFTTKGVGKGTGLGLATVFGIVRGGGGWVEVESVEGAGSTFRAYLPQVERAAPEAADDRLATAPPGTETVLLVEDEDGVRELSRYTLSACGYTVLDAGNADEAERRADAHRGPIHLLVSDVVMPGLGGPALAERVRARHPETEVLFVSGYNDDEVLTRGIVQNRVHFLQKPFTPRDLALKVRAVLDS